MLVQGFVTIARHHRNKGRVPGPCRKKICKKLGVDELRVCVNDAGQRNGRLRLIAFNQTPCAYAEMPSRVRIRNSPGSNKSFDLRSACSSVSRSIRFTCEYKSGLDSGGVRWVRRRSKRRSAVISLLLPHISVLLPTLLRVSTSTVKAPCPKLEQLKLTNLLVCGSARNLSHSTVHASFRAAPSIRFLSDPETRCTPDSCL